MDIYANSKCTLYSCPTLSKTQKPFLTFHNIPTPTHETPHEHPTKHPRPPTKCLTNTPPGVGADSSRPYPYINKYTYPHYRIYVSTLSHIHIHIIKHVHSFHRIGIFTSPHTHFPSSFRGYLRICGHDKSDPYSC